MHSFTSPNLQKYSFKPSDEKDSKWREGGKVVKYSRTADATYPPLPHYTHTPHPPSTGPGGGDGAGSGWRETMGSGRTTLCLCVAPEVANAGYLTRLGSARLAAPFKARSQTKLRLHFGDRLLF